MGVDVDALYGAGSPRPHKCMIASPSTAWNEKNLFPTPYSQSIKDISRKGAKGAKKWISLFPLLTFSPFNLLTFTSPLLVLV